MVNNRLAGDIGLCLSGTLWLISLWRLVFHWICCKEQRDSATSSWEITPRRIFHALLWLAMSLECVAYADVAGLIPLSSNREYATKLGYVLLEVIGRAMFEFLAFSTVTLLWLDTARNISTTLAGDGSRLLLESVPRVLLLGTGLILSLASMWEAVDILTSSNEASQVFRGHMFVEAVSWGIQAVVAALCTWLTAGRILALSTLPQSDLWTRWAVLSKPLVPMIVCTICYAIRSIWLFCLFITKPKTSSLADRYGVAFWIGFVWIPTFLPSAMQLYSARKRDRTTMSDREMDGRLDHPLLPTPVPPAEAFISFRRFRENHDLFSPFTAATDADPREEDSDLFEPAEGEPRELDYREGVDSGEKDGEE